MNTFEIRITTTKAAEIRTRRGKRGKTGSDYSFSYVQQKKKTYIKGSLMLLFSHQLNCENLIMVALE